MYYINKYCEDDFSFDKGELRAAINAYYNKINDEVKKQVENDIKVFESEGSDYNSLMLKYRDMPNLFLQVTSMYNFDGKPAKRGYKGGALADVGMFFVDYTNREFDDLSD